MHELSIAMSIIDIAIDESESRSGAAVKVIHLRLGPLSGVIKEALLSAYELAREGSPMSDAELVIEDVPLVALCAACNAERTLDCFQDLCCPECRTPCGTIVSGRELEIVAMEIES